MEVVLAQLDEMNKKFDALSKDVDTMKTRDRSRSPIRINTPEVGRSTLWADRDPDEIVDYNAPVNFSDEEDTGDSGSNLVEVSEQTAKLLKISCTRSVSNEARKRTRSQPTSSTSHSDTTTGSVSKDGDPTNCKIPGQGFVQDSDARA